MLSKGFLRVIIDNEIYLLDDIEDLSIDENKNFNIDLVIDRFSPEDKEGKDFKKRITDDIELAILQSQGEVSEDWR